MVWQRGNAQWRSCARRVSLALLVAAFLSALLPSAGNASTVNFTIFVDGPQEPTVSPSIWTGTATMDTVLNTLSLTVTNTGPPLLFPESAAHIHGFAPPGVPAGILFGLPPGSPKVAVWNFLEAEQGSIIFDLTYVNIHSTGFPGGEVRGQILRTPSCGDTVVDGGEQCDDGNNVNGDCCNSTCQLEPNGQSCGGFATCNNGFCVGPNNYNCHQVKDLKVPAKFVPVPSSSIQDQTGSFGCELKKPKFLCNPALLNGGPIADPNLHYCCYQTKCVPKKVAVAYDITDQLGNLRLETKKPRLLCLPCEKAEAP